MRGPDFINHFFMPSLDILSLDISSFFIESLDILSLAIESFFIESFDMPSLDMVSFFMSSAKAAGARWARARPVAIAADKRVLFFMRHSPGGFTLRFLGYHTRQTHPHQFPVVASWHSPHGFVKMVTCYRIRSGVDL